MRLLLLVLLLSLPAWAQLPVDVIEGDPVSVVDFASNSIQTGARNIKLDFAPWRVVPTPYGLLVLDLLGDRVGLLRNRFEPWPLQLQRPSDAAYYQGSVYILERSGRLLEVQPGEGRILSVLALDLTGAEGLAVADGLAHISFPALGEVRRLDLISRQYREPLTDLHWPTRLVAKDDLVWVAETGTGAIWEYSRDGRRLVKETRPGVFGLAHGKALRYTNIFDGEVSGLRQPSWALAGSLR